MKTMKSHTISIEELTEEDANNMRGGFAIPTIFTVSFIIAGIANFGDIRQGLKDGWNGTPRYVD